MNSSLGASACFLLGALGGILLSNRIGGIHKSVEDDAERDRLQTLDIHAATALPMKDAPDKNYPQEQNNNKQTEEPDENGKNDQIKRNRNETDASIVQGLQGAGSLASSTNKSSEVPSIRLVLQRFRSASLLLRPPGDDNNHALVATVGSPRIALSETILAKECQHPGGVAVYISFAASATLDQVTKAAKTVLNLPMVTRGQWGNDTTDTTNDATASSTGVTSLLKMACSCLEESKMNIKSSTAIGGVSLVIIPQANLISKVKQLGKSVQYRDQIDKARGKELYEAFCHALNILTLEHYFKVVLQQLQLPEALQVELKAIDPSLSSSKTSISSSNTGAPVDPSIPPSRLFRDDSLYGSWDDAGIPLTKKVLKKRDNGTTIIVEETVTKSASKKLKKLLGAQQRRHEQYLKAGPASLPQQDQTSSSDSIRRTLPELDPNFLQLVAGTFGNRQGFEFSSDMGPFCHVLHIG